MVHAKRLLETGRVSSVAQAAEQVGISRSSFYKYQEDIFPFTENNRGRIITLSIQIEDKTGLLSEVLRKVAEYQANILTIHQSVPVGGMASLSLSIQVLQGTGDILQMIDDMEKMDGVRFVKIMSRE